MDPLTAIGFASNILSFIDFGVKVVSLAVEVNGSSSGETQENRSSRVIVSELKTLASRLQPPDDGLLVGLDKSLCVLARECEQIAEQMIDILEKIKPKQGSKTSSLRAGFENKWYEKNLRRVEERLANCRAQLDFQLNYITSSENKSKLEALVVSARDNTAKLNQLHQQIDKIHQDGNLPVLSPTAQIQLKAIFRLSEYASDLIIQQHILASLVFDGMYGRFEAVDHAHLETFRWIYSDPEQSGADHESNEGTSIFSDESIRSLEERLAEKRIDSVEDTSIAADNIEYNQTEDLGVDYSKPNPEEIGSTGKESLDFSHIDASKSHARKILSDWLREGDGIFHVSGKLGSGKSTLMKYLWEEEHTKTLLHKWAGNRKLVSSSFFFWKPGSALQNSLKGLFRSLLYEVLKTCPEFIHAYLPDAWNYVKSSLWQGAADIHVKDSQIQQAFLRLISDVSIYRDHCFCFWIDGLDEYEGTYQNDQKALIDMFCAWTSAAPESLKLCVSSREYNVFMNALPANQRIRLHELIRMDIMRYTTAKLGHVDNTKDKEDLTRSIVDNAGGIFLWVVLVVRRIREQIEDGSSVTDLGEIENLPKELDSLFVHILDSLAISSLSRAYKTLSMLMKLSSMSTARLTLQAYSFLGDYTQDSSFAMKRNFEGIPFKDEQKKLREELALKALNGCCKGLAESVSRSDKKNSSPHLAFAHRSIPEFLSREERQRHMLYILGEFNPTDAISQLSLAELVAYPESINTWPSSSLLSCLPFLRFRAGIDSRPYEFLESLSTAIEQFKTDKEPELPPIEISIPSRLGTGFSYVVETIRKPRPGSSGAAIDPVDPIYSAALSGNSGYLSWRLRESSIDLEPAIPEVLLHCLVYMFDEKTIDLQEAVETIITSGSFGPDMISEIGICGITEFDPKTNQYTEPAAMAIWWHLLASCYCWNRSGSVGVRNFGYIFEIYLEHGADPYFQFYSWEEQESPLLKSNMAGDGVRSIEEGDSKESIISDQSSTMDTLVWRARLVLGKEKMQKVIQFPKGTYVSCEAENLSTFIAMFDFENNDRLMELIERNLRITGGPTKTDIDASELPIEVVVNDKPGSRSDIQHYKGKLDSSTHENLQDHLGISKMVFLSGASLSICMAIFLYWVLSF